MLNKLGVFTSKIKNVNEMKGEGLFRYAFFAIVQVNASRLNKHRSNMETAEVVCTYQNLSFKRRLSIFSSQTVAAELFLHTYGELNGLHYTTSCKTKEGKPVVWLSNDTKKKQVYIHYMKEWSWLLTFVKRKEREMISAQKMWRLRKNWTLFEKCKDGNKSLCV